ncbi:TIR domain-containing protein [Agitococcus lubricus]|uniref:histidine kinase n=1 Tax=Agitococcus lubricus TaxID=1077255 RepID=A0A2T5IT89_9GAMM|nr:TIR domain-containing protein [Agitococcus lubricus]PTQ87069.1 histidine kinase/DNA gyrase B/HSP90-like ATPase [Agitococcus lubricus]
MSHKDTRHEWDVFISHASEDKSDVVRPLAEALARRGLRVWYDEYTLKLGNSIRREIDRGLTSSRFGIVVLSPSFMQKEWPQKELDFLVSVDDARSRRILPVWHNLNAKQVQDHFPLLADRIAVTTDAGISAIADKMVEAIVATQDDGCPRPLEELSQQRLYDLLVTQPGVKTSHLQSMRILHVEDEPLQGLLLAQNIEKAVGARCDVAAEGIEALDKLKQGSFDIVLSDIMMPRMGGLELYLQINALYPDLPVVFVSGFSEYDKLPCAGYILKPYSVDEIINKVADILDDAGLFRLSHSLFTDGNLTYRQLSSGRDIISLFLSRYRSDDLFESALRHKIKDVVRKFCQQTHKGMTGDKVAKNLVTNLSRLEKLMEQIRHGSKNGLYKILRGIEEDIHSERPGVTMSILSPKRLPASIAGADAETFLALCIMEFIGNALDAITKKASIRVVVRTKKTRNALFASVWNDGPEIPENMASRVFDEGVSSKGEGRGMGLYIIKRISERFGAEVSLDQADGVQFSVVLPLEQQVVPNKRFQSDLPSVSLEVNR